ncbi:MAG: cobalt/nickel transport system permease protein [Archaeoglobi archaeon]|nr:cobalt/nickel transport system permease protein [Archaeoglobi archaeon]
MHIPDSYLDVSVAVVFTLLSLGVLALSLKKVDHDGLSPLFGLLSASIFAAQMLNWPIIGGTSAHFVGGALAGILLGPYAGALAMAVVLTIQALFFGDGGIIAWGANVWNMAIVNVFAGYYIYRALEKYSRTAGAFIAGWAGITLAALFAGFEVGISNSFAYSLKTTLSVMGIWHGILGIVEGAITAGIVGYISTRRPEILEGRAHPSKSAFAIIALMVAVSPFFAYAAEMVNYSEPLENAAELIGLEEYSIYSGLMPDYSIPGIDPYVGTLLTAAIGTVIVAGFAFLIRYARDY